MIDEEGAECYCVLIFLWGQDGVCVQKQILGGFNSRFMNG